MRDEQRPVVFFGKRTARQNVGRIGYGKRRLDRIDAADDIAVLRGGLETGDFLPSERQEYLSRRLAERGDGFAGVIHHRPAVAFDRFPGRAAQRQRGDAGKPGSLGRIGRNLRRIGMRRVDQQVDSFVSQISGQAFRTAKTAAAHRHALRDRAFGAAGKRQGEVAVATLRQVLGEFPCFRGTAEDQDSVGHHAC